MGRLFAVLLIVFAAAAGERPKPRLEVQAVLDRAPAAPPELAADVLLKLVDQDLIPSREQRLELIEQAFQLAGQARFAWAQSPAVGVTTNTDSSPGIRYSALTEGLSGLSLRCRAVRAALALDKAKARELFRQITPGPFPALTCDDSLTPSVAVYYETLAEVARTAYTPEERKEERHLEFIGAAVHGMTYPKQLEPVAQVLRSFPLPPDGRKEFVGAYAAAMKQMTADPRSAALDSGMGYALIELADGLRSEGISTLPLLDAFATYLTNHLRGPLCGEDVSRTNRKMVEGVYNTSMLAPAGAAEMQPLVYAELKPASVGGRAKFSVFWQGTSARIMRQYRELRFGTEEQRAEYNKLPRRADGMARFLPDEIRRTPEWETKAREFLNELERWAKNHDDPPDDFFHSMCIMYGALMDIVPAGTLRESVLASYLTFLKSSPMELESPPEWLLHVKQLFRIYRCDTGAAGARPHRRPDQRRHGDEPLRRAGCAQAQTALMGLPPKSVSFSWRPLCRYQRRF